MKRSVQFCGIAGLVILVFGLITRALVSVDELRFVPVHFVIGGTLLAIFFFGGGYQALRGAAARRAAGFGISVTVYSSLFVGILVLFNFLVARHELFHLDGTEEKVHTLAPQTERILDSLEQEVIMRGFFLAGEIGNPALEDLIKRIDKRSEKLRWRMVDPEKSPTLLKKFGISEAGMIHFSFADGSAERAVRIARNINEQEIANALLKLTRGNGKKVYYITGHGEPDIDGMEETGYRLLADAVRGENLEFENLVLADRAKIPEDAHAIILAAPQRALLEKERKQIEDYLRHGGNALLLHEPRLTDDIASLVKPFGVDVGENIVVDQMVELFAGPSLGVEPMVTTYGGHPITEGFAEGTVFSTSASVQRVPNSEASRNVTELAFSSNHSWAESNIEQLFSDDPSAKREENDFKGPVPLAAAFTVSAEDSKTPGRVVVFGDADFVSNVSIRQLFNRDFFLNALNWSVGEDGLVTIRAKTLRESTKGISTEQFSFMFLFTAVLLPEAILLSGFGVWWRRRGE